MGVSSPKSSIGRSGSPTRVLVKYATQAIAAFHQPSGRPVALRRQLRQGATGRHGVGVVGADDALADVEGALVKWSGETQ